MIPYGRQSISAEDIQAVVDVLHSDWLTQGPVVIDFERAMAKQCGVAHTLAVSNGTAALHLACLAIGFGPGDILWTSPNTFVASANCAIYCGGTVDFVDIDPRTYNLSVDALEQKLKIAEHEGRLPKVLVPVHFAGQSCDMARIHLLSRKYGFYVIEDACHALGGRYQDTTVGCCRYSDLTVFSFHAVKGITTGEGGMVTTNDEQLHRRLTLLRSHGITKDPDCLSDPNKGGWCYEQVELGYNYRMTDIQAALGLSQLKRIDKFVARRQQLAARYDEALCDSPLQLPLRNPDSDSACHLYPVKFDAGSEIRRQVYDRLNEAGIHTQVHYIPLHTQPFYRKRNFQIGDFPVAEDYYQGALSLPLYYGLSDADQDFVIKILLSSI